MPGKSSSTFANRMSGVLPIWPSSECADWMAVLGATGTMCGYLLIVEIPCKVCQRKGIAFSSVLEADCGGKMQKTASDRASWRGFSGLRDILNTMKKTDLSRRNVLSLGAGLAALTACNSAKEE